ncbi:MAG: tol-pal system protein YbgF [Xanthomonadales bacterium]|nr:tol-pal system protein YbgF [Xanthomonadales bacterium]
MTIRRVLRVSTMAALAAAMVAPVLAQDGRLSLAERVARLEQQGQSAPATGGGNMELLNRIQEMQVELQSLRNLVEQQAFEIDALKKRQNDQYADLDDRINRLGGGGGAGGDEPLSLRPSSGAGTAPLAPARPADPDQLMMEEAAPVDPYTGQPMPAGAAASPLPAGDPQAEYQTAFDALKQGRYDESASLFRAFLRAWPAHELADNAQYWLGESYYVTQNYETALATFRELVAAYPDSDKTADAELKIGYCLYELGRYDAARGALEGVSARWPDTTVARLAESRLRALALEQR